VWLVAYAVAELGGAFTIGRLYEAFKGELSKRQLEKLAREWERGGWLTTPESVTEPRRVTEALLALLRRGAGEHGSGGAREISLQHPCTEWGRPG